MLVRLPRCDRSADGAATGRPGSASVATRPVFTIAIQCSLRRVSRRRSSGRRNATAFRYKLPIVLWKRKTVSSDLATNGTRVEVLEPLVAPRAEDVAFDAPLGGIRELREGHGATLSYEPVARDPPCDEPGPREATLTCGAMMSCRKNRKRSERRWGVRAATRDHQGVLASVVEVDDGRV